MFDIGVDADGVMHDFVQSLRKYVVDQGIRTADQCAIAEKMDFFRYWYDDKGRGIELDEFNEICHAGVDAGVVFFYGEPFDDVKDSLERMKSEGHRIHVITDRTFGTNNHSEVLTKTWLDQYSLPYDTLTFSADKTIVPTDIMIDDKIQNYDELDADGCYAILYERPWNAMNDDRRRVRSLREFADLVSWLTFQEIYEYENA